MCTMSPYRSLPWWTPNNLLQKFIKCLIGASCRMEWSQRAIQSRCEFNLPCIWSNDVTSDVVRFVIIMQGLMATFRIFSWVLTCWSKCVSLWAWVRVQCPWSTIGFMTPLGWKKIRLGSLLHYFEEEDDMAGQVCNEFVILGIFKCDWCMCTKK